MSDTDRDPAACSRILREVEAATPRECTAYIAGAAHDGTFSRLHNTIRISQAVPAWLAVLQAVIHRLGSRSWVYREGVRRVWVVESTFKVGSPLNMATPGEKAAYARGYFDAEGGMPRNGDSRFYIQVTQKDHHDLQQVREFLEDLGVRCGRIHNPSARVDPGYWRFYVLARAHADFAARVGSWHPGKWPVLAARAGVTPGVGRRI